MFTGKLKKLGIAMAMVLAVVVFGNGSAKAAANYVGPNACKDCHSPEFEVWQGTAHFKSYKTIHKNKKAKAIVKAIGGKSMKRTETCAQCHYTVAPKKAGGKSKANFGPSCESCHGAASEFIGIHNVYGPKGSKRDQETAEHKAKRVADAKAAGMIWPRGEMGQRFDVAYNCFECHGMARETLDGDTAGKMLDAGHPINPDYEVVLYSQGSVRHRFYNSASKNEEMNQAELSRWFVTGQAASLVQAERAMSKTSHAKYIAAQKTRAERAKAVLSSLGLAEASALVAKPTVENGRKLVNSIYAKNLDLSGKVGGSLPAKGSYK